MDEEARKKTTDVIQSLLDKVETAINQETLKTTMSDYLRLVQLRTELDENEPKNIEVKWVDPEETDGSAEK